MLAVSGLHVAYGESEVLHGLDFEVQPNEIVAVMGRNGRGKTTLMKSLIGLVPSSQGAIRIGESEITGLKSHQRVARGVAYVPQGRMIFSTMTVEENVETGLTVTGERKVPGDIYELFPVLLEMKGRRGGNLSGGQQQQLAIARALASKPKVLLLDEPTGHLDERATRGVMDLFWDINAQGMAVLMATHDLELLRRHPNARVFELDEGRLVYDSGTDQVRTASEPAGSAG